MSPGIFAKYQPRYAEQNVITFPVSPDKKPAISNWQKVGRKASAQLALKFGQHDAIGYQLGRYSGIAAVDFDTKDAKAVADFEGVHGSTPVLIGTPGGYHALYKHGGERRHIRPWGPDVPIDVLGGGFIIAPPSRVAKGEYQIIRGTLDDLKDLPPLHAVLDGLRQGPIPQGVRNTTVFHRLLREVRHCDDFDSLLDVARSLNMDCIPQQTDATLVNTAKKVWEYETSGNNWVGRRARASTDREEILSLSRDPWALMLLQLLRVSFPAPEAVFPIDQVKVACLLDWDRGTLVRRIATLMGARKLARVHPGKGKGDPHLYQLIRSAK